MYEVYGFVNMIRVELPKKWYRVRAIVKEQEDAKTNKQVVDELYQILNDYYGEQI